MTTFIFIFGFLFGGILQYAKLNRFNTISGLALGKDFTVAKAILIAIGVGAILITLEVGFGLTSYHTKPIIIGGIVLGGIVFGSGMAILGYCPGTLPVSAGEGSIDAMIGIIGGLVGGLVYTFYIDFFKNFIGPDLGNISLNSVFSENLILFYVLVLIIAGSFIAFAFWIHKKEKSSNIKWVASGIALAILNSVIILKFVSDRPIGASTSYPYVADYIFGFTNNDYFSKIQIPGQWELIFLSGAFISGLLFSMIRKEFKFVLIYENWNNYQGNSTFKRIIWSFIGGGLIIIGARLAGGCTSGHILSGGMQIAFSSLIFTLFVFAGLLITGKLFYRAK